MRRCSENRIIKITERLMSASRSLPEYSCRKLRHDYTQQQLLVIWCLMKYLKANYRGITEILGLMPQLLQLLGLESVPHFTTINKFFLRIGTESANALFVGTVCWFNINGTIIAIDSTGYSNEHASKYYAIRMHGELLRRSYVKLSMAVCSKQQCIVANYARLGPRNDTIDFPWLVEQTAMLVKPAYVVADKGYDSEANHRLVRNIGSKPMIPLRRQEGYGTKGSYRKKMLRHFNDDIYHRRELVETVNSVMKRLLGSSVQSRSLTPQCVEVTLMCMIYNTYRKTVIGFYGWFLQSPFWKKHIWQLLARIPQSSSISWKQGTQERPAALA